MHRRKRCGGCKAKWEAKIGGKPGWKWLRMISWDLASADALDHTIWTTSSSYHHAWRRKTVVGHVIVLIQVC